MDNYSLSQKLYLFLMFEAVNFVMSLVTLVVLVISLYLFVLYVNFALQKNNTMRHIYSNNRLPS